MSDITQRYEDLEINELIGMAMFLDPRLKLDYVDEDVEAAAIKDRIAKEGADVASKMKPTDLTTNESEDVEPPSKRRRLGTLLKEISKEQKPHSSPDLQLPEKKVKEEIEGYLRARKPDPQSDPLQWSYSQPQT